MHAPYPPTDSAADGEYGACGLLLPLVIQNISCCRTVLMVLRETCIFTTARAATSVAAESARVPHGRAAVVRRRRSLTNGGSRDTAACIHAWIACASGGQGYFQHYSATEPISSKIPLWFETSPLRGKRVVDKTAKPMKSFSVPPPFRAGQSARPLPVGCGVSRRMGRLWIETSQIPLWLALLEVVA